MAVISPTAHVALSSIACICRTPTRPRRPGSASGPRENATHPHSLSLSVLPPSIPPRPCTRMRVLPTQGVNISQIEAKADELLKKMDVNNDSQIDVTEFTFMVGLCG